MGSKRIGLARVEAMLESLKRELDFAGSRFVAVKGVEMCAYSAEAEADGTEGFTSAAISIPANAVITNMGCVVTSNLVLSTTMKLECFFGTTVGGHELTASDDDGLMANGAGPLVAGKGTSTIAHENTILGGNATLVPEANQGYSTSARTIYGSIVPSTGDIDSGKAKFWVRYILLD